MDADTLPTSFPTEAAYSIAICTPQGKPTRLKLQGPDAITVLQLVRKISNNLFKDSVPAPVLPPGYSFVWSAE